MTHTIRFLIPATLSLMAGAACSSSDTTDPATQPVLSLSLNPDSLDLAPGGQQTVTVKGGLALCGARLSVLDLPTGILSTDITPPNASDCGTRYLQFTANNRATQGTARLRIHASKPGYRSDPVTLAVHVTVALPTSVQVQVTPDSLTLQPWEAREVIVVLNWVQATGYLPDATVSFPDLPPGVQALPEGSVQRDARTEVAFYITAGDVPTTIVRPQVMVSVNGMGTDTARFALQVSGPGPGAAVAMDLTGMPSRDDGYPFVAARDGDGPWKLFFPAARTGDVYSVQTVYSYRLPMASGRGAIAWQDAIRRLNVRFGTAEELNGSRPPSGGAPNSYSSSYRIPVSGVLSDQAVSVTLGNANGSGSGTRSGNDLYVISRASGDVDLLATTTPWGMPPRFILRRNSPQPFAALDFVGAEVFSLENQPLNVANAAPTDTLEIRDTLVTDKARLLLAAGALSYGSGWQALPSERRDPADRYRLVVTANGTDSWRQVVQEVTGPGAATITLAPQPVKPDVRWTTQRGDLRLAITWQPEYADSLSLAIISPVDAYCDRDGGPGQLESVTVLGGYAARTNFTVEVPDFSSMPGFGFLATWFPPNCNYARTWQATVWGRNASAGWQ